MLQRQLCSLFLICTAKQNWDHHAKYELKDWWVQILCFQKRGDSDLEILSFHWKKLKKNLSVTQPMGAQSETTENIAFCSLLPTLDLQLSFFVYFMYFKSFCNEPFVKPRKTNHSWLRYLEQIKNFYHIAETNGTDGTDVPLMHWCFVSSKFQIEEVN